MADPNNLADIFSSSVARAPYADLNQFESTVGANSIYNQLAAPIISARFNTSSWSPAETGLTLAGQAFLGTVLSKLAERDRASQLQSAAGTLKDLYANPLGTQAPEDVNPEAYNQLRLGAIKAQNDKEVNKKEKTDTISEQLFADVFSKNPAIALKMMPDTAKRLGINNISADTSEARSADSTPNIGSGNKIDFGEIGESTLQKFNRYVKEIQDANPTLSPQQVGIAARQQVEGEIKANTKTFDEAKSAREQGQKLLDLANTAEAGMSQAGVTGNFQGIRHAADYLAATFGNQTSQERLTGDQVLSSIAPDLVKASRSPGAVSDYETKLYLGSGPSVNNTPETNAILVNKIKNLGKLNLDYADFLDAYREAKGGSTSGAQAKWEEYRQAFPVFKKTDLGYEIDNNRPSWQDYFSNRGAAILQQQEQVKAPSNIPGIGQMFNNEKVISIKKIS